MLLQVGTELQDGENEFVELLGKALAGDILVEYLCQVAEFVDQIGVVVGKMVGHGFCRRTAVQKPLQVGEDVALLTLEMLHHLFAVVFKEAFQYGAVTFAGTPGHMHQVPLDVGKPLVEVVAVAGFEVRHQRAEVGPL